MEGPKVGRATRPRAWLRVQRFEDDVDGIGTMAGETWTCKNDAGSNLERREVLRVDN